MRAKFWYRIITSYTTSAWPREHTIVPVCGDVISASLMTPPQQVRKMNATLWVKSKRKLISKWRHQGISNTGIDGCLDKRYQCHLSEFKRNSFKADIYKPIHVQAKADQKRQKIYQGKHPLKNRDIYAYSWIRCYLPKGTDFSTTSDEELKAVEDELNNRQQKDSALLPLMSCLTITQDKPRVAIIMRIRGE